MTEWIKTADAFGADQKADCQEAMKRFLEAAPRWVFALAIWPDTDTQDGVRVSALTRGDREKLAEVMRWMRDEYIPQMLRTLEN